MVPQGVAAVHETVLSTAEIVTASCHCLCITRALPAQLSYHSVLRDSRRLPSTLGSQRTCLVWVQAVGVNRIDNLGCATNDIYGNAGVVQRMQHAEMRKAAGAASAQDQAHSLPGHPARHTCHVLNKMALLRLCWPPWKVGRVGARHTSFQAPCPWCCSKCTSCAGYLTEVT